MRTLRSACAVLATVFACAIGAAPAIADTVVIDSVDSPSSVFQPDNVTIETGDTVRWEFDAAATTHNVKSTSSNWSINESRGPNGAPIERTFDTAGTYTFLCDAPHRHDGLDHRRGARARPRARLLQDRRLPPRLDPAGHRGDPGARHGQRLRRSSPPRTRPSSRTPTSPPSTSSSSCRRPARSSTTPSRPPSSATSRAAAASPASTRPPTPSTPGRGSASWSAATSAATRPERPPPRSTSRTATSPPPPACRPAGRARTSGTTTSTRRPRSSTATPRSPTTPRAPVT